MKENILKAIGQVMDAAGKEYDPETYFNHSNGYSTGYLNSTYILGNFFGKGYCEEKKVNFEIFKDHSTWQIWIWKFDEEKNVNQNNFSQPYYAYDKLVEFIEANF